MGRLPVGIAAIAFDSGLRVKFQQVDLESRIERAHALEQAPAVAREQR